MSVWGTFSSFTGQLQQLTQEVIKNPDSILSKFQDEEEDDYEGEREDEYSDEISAEKFSNHYANHTTDNHKDTVKVDKSIQTTEEEEEESIPHKQKIKELKEEIRQLQDALNEAELQNISISSHYRKLLQHNEAEINELKIQVAHKEVVSSTPESADADGYPSESDVPTLLAKINELKTQSEDLQKEFEVEKQAKDEKLRMLEKEIKSANAQKVELQQQMDALHSQLELKGTEYASLNEQYSNMQLQHKQSLSEMEELHTQLQLYKTDIERMIKEQQSSALHAQEEKHSLQQTIQQLQTELKALSSLPPPSTSHDATSPSSSTASPSSSTASPSSSPWTAVESEDNQESAAEYSAIVQQLKSEVVQQKNLLEAAQTETVSLKLKIDELQHEVSVLQQQQQDTSEVDALKEQLEKSNRALERLRTHLIDTEEAHTKYSIAKEEQLTDLTSQIEQLKKSEEALLLQNKDHESLKEQLEQKELEFQRTNDALINLQVVLERIQSERESQAQAEIALVQKQLATTQQQLSAAHSELEELRNISQRCKAAEKTIIELQEELSQKTRTFVKLQEEVEPIRRARDTALQQLTLLMKNEETLVDKRVISKLVLTFIKQSNKTEVLELFARILSWTEEEKKQAGMYKSQRGWLPSLWGSSAASSAESKSNSTSEKSLTDMWVEFLLKEADSASTAKKC